MTIEDLKVYLPKFLSSESEKELYEGLKQFPENIDSRLYTSALKTSKNIFQGDGLKDLLVVNLPDEKVIKAKGMIFSNSCDINPNNKRNFESQFVYAPIFNLDKYHKLVSGQSKKSKEEIQTHINAIKKQRITQIFFLPKIQDTIEDSIVFLDRVNSCSLDFIKTKEIQNDRLFTLSDYGAYLFVTKLSIHFSRIKDKVDRLEGTIQ